MNSVTPDMISGEGNGIRRYDKIAVAQVDYGCIVTNLRSNEQVADHALAGDSVTTASFLPRICRLQTLLLLASFNVIHVVDILPERQHTLLTTLL